MNKEERLGKFDKWGYKNSFSKGELARELVYMNKDYDELQQENKQLKVLVDIYENKINVLKELLKEKSEKMQELEGDNNE